MNVVYSPTHQQVSPPGQFQNICKICKKVYTDKAGLMEHQKQQHPQPSISIAQKVQRLQQNFNKGRLQFSNGNSTDSVIHRNESIATLQRSPPDLMKPKPQSPRKQQFHSSNGDSVIRDDNNDEFWPKRSKREPEPPTIIDDTLAAATAACYSPQIPGTSTSTGNTVERTLLGSTATTPSPVVQPKTFKISPQFISKVQQNMSNATNAANRNQPVSPNGKAKLNKPAVPKLMSQTKAQYQILKSQVTRPKLIPKGGPRPAELQQYPPKPVQGSNNAVVGAGPSVPVVGSPTITKQSTASGSTSGLANRKPPPTTTISPRITTPITSIAEAAIQYSMGARRGGGATAGRGGRIPTATTRTKPQSDQSEDDDEYGYSTPSPPPEKPSFRGSPRGRNASPPKQQPQISPQSKKKDEGRIFGKDYKCPPMNKVASFLTKKGVRVWICLVCEEAEHESSKDPMICCDGCEDWYHFLCVGIQETPPEDEKWFCKRCIYRKLQAKKGKNQEESPKKSKTTSSPSSKSRSPASSPAKRGKGMGGGRGGSRAKGRN